MMRTKSSRRSKLVLAALAVFGPWLAAPARADAAPAAPSLAAECVSCGPFQIVGEDTRAVFKAPLEWQKPEWRSVMRKALVVAGAMAALDGSVRDRLQEHRTASTDRIADAFEPFGNRYAAGVLLGYALAGKLGNKPALASIAMDGASAATIAAGMIVPALKEMTGRSRPRVGAGASDFHPFNGGASFPSGHTAAAFAIAGVIAAHDQRRWVRGLAYGVATMVAYSRMESDAHFLSDVTAGAMIGIGVAKRVSAFNDRAVPRGMLPRPRARRRSQSAPPPPRSL